MSRNKTGSGFVVGRLSQLLSAVLAVMLLRGFQCLPNWGLGLDLTLAGSIGLLFWLVGRVGAGRETDRSKRSDVTEGNIASPDSQTLLHLSHEIRSPMNALVGYVRLLKNGQFQDEIERQKQLEIVHNSGVRLLQLVDQILEHSKLENGHDQVRLQDACLFSMLVETEELFQLAAVEKGLALNLLIRGSLPSTIRTDPLKFRQLLHNLVTNAIKFTPDGSVNICVAMENVAGRDCLEIQVVDSGIGIPRDQIDEVFAPFTQLRSGAGRRSSGAGLGLSISRQLTDQLGGTLEVQSAVGTGTVFTLRMNCECQVGSRLTYQQFLECRESASRTPLRSAVNRLNGMQVMIVDDDASHRRLFQLYLEQRGATTLLAEHGEEALELLEDHRVDLVLVDMQMPVMDGIETTVQFRRRGFRKPVIGISAQAEASPGCQDRELGFSGWLQKPVDSRSLDRLLERLLRDQRIWVPTQEARSVGDRSSSRQGKLAPSDNGTYRPTDGRLAPQVLTVQVPEIDAVQASQHWLVHPAHPLENGHAVAPEIHDRPFTRHDKAVNRPAQTAHTSWPVGGNGIEEVGLLFLESLQNKLDDIRKSPLGHRGPLVRQFAHWLKGTAPMCGFQEFSRSVVELETALESQCGQSCTSRLLEIEAIAETIGGTAVQ